MNIMSDDMFYFDADEAIEKYPEIDPKFIRFFSLITRLISLLYKFATI